MKPLTVLPSSNAPSTRIPNQVPKCWESAMARQTLERGARTSKCFSMRSVLWAFSMAIIVRSLGGGVDVCATVMLHILPGAPEKRNPLIAYQDAEGTTVAGRDQRPVV